MAEFLGDHLQMCFLVPFQSSQLTEVLVALVTHVGLCPRVSAQVDIEVPFVVEVFVTDFTLVRFFVCVDPLVTSQGGVVGELFEADFTGVWLLPSVDPLVNSEV